MRHAKRIGNLFWYGGFGLLILVAVLLSVARLLMPQLQEYHRELESRIAEGLGVEVSIGAVDARLVGITPTLILSELQLSEENGQQARLGEVGLGLDSLQSLFEWKPVLKRLSVDGARLTLERAEDGRLHLHGLGHLSGKAVEASSVGNGGDSQALGWVFSQGGLRLRDGSLTWIDRQRDERFEFIGMAMELRNDGQRHRLRAGVQLPEALGGDLNLAMELHGPLQNLDEWRGDIYLKGGGLRPGPWLPPLSGVRMEQGSVDLELWSRWEKARPAELEGRVVASSLQLAGRQAQWQREHIEARLHGYFGNGGWRLDLAGLALNPERDTPSNLSLENSGDYWRLQADYLPLAPLSALAQLSDALPDTLRRQLKAMQPQGELQSVRLEHDGLQGPRAQATAMNLGWKAYRKLPGVVGLDASIRLDRNSADLHLNSHEAALDLPELFRSPLKAQTLQGGIHLRRLEGVEGWRLHARELQLANEDIRAQLALDLSLPKAAPPYLDLRGRFHDGNAAAAPRYYPAALLKGPTLHWLDRAFKAGDVVSGGVLYHGQLKRGAFPFRDMQGRFEVRFDARDVTLDYREEWPVLRRVNGEVLFEGAGMRIQGSARLYDSPVDEVEVRIDDLKRPLLQVHGHARPRGVDASRMLRESPLAHILGRSVASMELSGNSRLQLDLKIPLSREMAESLPLKVDGVLQLSDNRLHVREGITVEGLSGDLGFSERALKAEALQGRIFGGPVNIAGFTDEVDGQRHTRIAARGNAVGERLGEQLDYPFIDTLAGEAHWQALLDIAHGGITSLRIDSDLLGMGVNLPPPLGKAPSDEESGLALDIQLSGEHAGEVALAYGERLHALFEPHPEGGLRRAALHFGRGRAELPEEEQMTLSGVLEGVDPQQWMRVLSRGSKGAAEGEASFRLPLSVDMRRFSLSNDEAAGASAEPADGGGDRRMPKLPPIDVRIRNFSYDGMNLGQLSLQLLPTDGGGVQLHDLQLRHATYSATAEGEWSPQNDQSQLRLRMSSGDVGEASKALGFASVISDGQVDMNASLRWPGMPTAIAMETVTGRINLNIDEGRIEEVDPGAGKLLGLLSLQALPRRLILDFSDLFNKGMPFEKLSGQISLEQGSAYTQNLRMESLSADVLVTGRSGLVARDFDQLVMVVPKVSGSLPMAAGLTLGPQAGVVMLLLQRLIGKDIDRSAMVSYSVKGSWENPQIEQLQVALPQPTEEGAVE